MIDYGPGDEIVYIGSGTQIYESNKIYMCTDIGPTTYKHRNRYTCTRCGTLMEDCIGVWTPASLIEMCACNFRKKLDFKKLCNVDEKIKEDA